jgi:hypothetical protein
MSNFESAIHPSDEMLRRFTAGTLPPRELIDTSRHIARCETCAAIASGSYDIDRAASAVREQVIGQPLRWMPIAAALAGAALLIAVWLTTQQRVSNQHPLTPPLTISTTERPEWQALAATALEQGRIDPPPILQELRPAAGSLRAAAPKQTAEALAPVGTVVETDRPRFTWTPVTGANSYRVLLFSRGAEVTRSEALTTSAWQPAAPLSRGNVYEWQVIASTPHGDVVLPPPDAPRALFGVVALDAADEIAAARRERPGDTLLTGLLYARAGVIDRAAQELRAYAAAHPSPSASSLLRCVEQWRP